jgi:DNA-binding NarL/FixJ family response regulator
MVRQDIPDLPLPCGLWTQLVKELHLPPQQLRIVELILRNQCDKQIAQTLGIKIPTLRTYVERIYHRLGVHDRMELVLKLFAMSHELGPAER